MRYKVLVSEAALEDLEEIKLSIVRNYNDVYSAQKVEKKIKLSINSLTIMPARSRITANLYKVHAGKYKIIYEINSNIVLVLAIIHTKRDFSVRNIKARKWQI